MMSKISSMLREHGRALALAALLGLAASVVVAAEKDKDKEADQKSAAKQAELEDKLAAARKRLDIAAREVADLSMALSDNMVTGVRTFTRMVPPRAMLGINLGSRRDSQGADGVEIVSVSPGGAAEQAGLKAGDVLMDVKGTALKSGGDESPREKLLAAMRDVKPGDSVPVSYRRDGKVLKTKLVAQALGDHFFTMQVPPGAGAVRGGGFGVFANGGPRFAFMRAEGVFGSAELVALTPKLGQYFGTDKGLLVVHAPEDSRLKLEDGDVIVDIDGRTPNSPKHAFIILSSYQPGEKLKLNILRAKQRMSFEVTVPDEPFEKRVGTHMIDGDVFFGPGPSIEAVPALPGAPGLPLPPPLPPEAGTISITTLPDDPV